MENQFQGKRILFYCDNTAVVHSFCFVALRPKSTSMVMAGRSVHLTTHIKLKKTTAKVERVMVLVRAIVK